MNNSTFGKTMENVRKRGNYELVNSPKRLKKIISSRWFKNFIPISEDLALVEKHAKIIKLNKPLQIGAQILDISKISLVDFYYDHVVKVFKNVNLIVTDTDSFMIQVFSNDASKSVYEIMFELRDLYDFSNTTPNNGLYPVI